MKCGYEEPSKEETAFSIYPKLSFNRIFNLSLFDNDTAVVDIEGIKHVLHYMLYF